ncbi:hypothetical protein FACS1894161_0940 [Spirochaetia bacterium]|nr:hypothetical protein FACS1894161_0940 [Spirochaetia bacterium]
MIVVPVKNGMTVPTIDDLKNFQLGYNRSDKKLYIRDNDKIIEFCQGIEYVPPPPEHYIEITFDATGTANLCSQWEGQSTYQLNEGQEYQLPDSSTATSITVNSGDTIKIRGNFRSWRNSDSPLVKDVSSHISKMPSMDFFTVDPEGTTAGDYFFICFNYRGSLTSFPVGSFDTSKITTVGDYFFAYFNEYGQITSLPAGSFDISNITGKVGSCFFNHFNSGGQLTSLPNGSFRLNPNLITVGTYFFYMFNDSGKLTSLPDGSFNTSNITTVGVGFFGTFNSNGKIPKKTSGGINIQNKYSSAITAYYWNGSSSNSESITYNRNYSAALRSFKHETRHLTFKKHL